MSLPSSNDKAIDAGAGQFWSGLWCGVSEPSPAGTIGIGLVAAGLFIACFLWMTPDHLAELDQRYFMTVHVDDYTEISFGAMRAAKAGPAPFAVAIFGDSSIRAAMPDAQAIEDALARQMGASVPVHFMAAKGMNLIEKAGVMDYIGKDFNGIVVIQMLSIYQLAQTEKQLATLMDLPRLAIDTPVYDEELTRVAGRAPIRTGLYLFDHWRYYAYRVNKYMLRNTLFGIQPMKRERKPLTPDMWEPVDQRVRDYLHEYPSNRDRNIAMLNRMIERLRRNGRVEVVLVETPINPIWHQLVSPELAQDHHSYWEQWVEKQGVHFWDFNQEMDFAPEDFYDHVHLSSPEVQRGFTQQLAQRIAHLAVQWHTQESKP